MYHSITFGDGSLWPKNDNASGIPDLREGQFRGINTWDDWHLIPSAAPSVATPEVYTNYLDLPGIPGKLDLSEYLTGAPVYKNRSGSFEFYAPPGYGYWAEKYAQICNILHGKKIKMVLEDEPDYFYEGRFKVDPWKREASYGSVSIGYELRPMKFLLPHVIYGQAQYSWDRFRMEDKNCYQCYWRINSGTYPEFYLPGYPDGYYIDAEVNDESMLPALARIIIGGQTITVAKRPGDAVTQHTGTLPVLDGATKIQIAGPTEAQQQTYNTAFVNLIIYGGTL